MKTIVLNDQTSLDAVINEATTEEVVLTRNGHAIALVTPFDDEDLQWYAREHDPAFLESIAAAREQTKQGKTVSHTDLKKELGVD